MAESYEKLYEQLCEILHKKGTKVNFEMVEKAYNVAKEAHKEQKRVSGMPYVLHPLSVAITVAEMEMDWHSVCAALLHDVVEDTDYTIEDIRDMFGESVAELVDGVTKLDKIQYSDKEEREMENLRKMFLAMAKDIRVIIIKFADRLHNMTTLISMSEEKQREKARETLNIFAPLAHRLGMYKIKWELEDLSLKYIDPIAYYEIVEGISQKRQEREEFIATIKATLRSKLEKLNIDCAIDGRPKHFYSIYRKMFTQNKTLDQIYDLFAVRVITDTVADCYAALGAAHELYIPMPGRFKDYIAMPKPNMYQSLHTTVIGPNGIPFEIQIRTREMHAVAENGIAAHWKYKNGGQADKSMDENLAWVKQLLEMQKDATDEEEFITSLKIDLFTDQVFVFTPKGDVMSFPAGATPIDFAFSIHSAVGCKMQGAKVNGKIVPLDYAMQNGDIVEVITSSAIHGPNLDWLKIVKTSQARNKINQWFKKENREANIIKGREAIEREIKRQSLTGYNLMRTEYMDPLIKRYGFKTYEDMFSAVGFGGMPVNKVISRLKEEYRKDVATDDILPVDTIEIVKSSKKKANNSGIVIEGIDSCLIRYAGCCNPVPGDKIIGYITRGRGVSIHRQDCTNIANAYIDEEEKARLIDVTWEINKDVAFTSHIKIVANDRTGIVLDVTNVIADMKVPLKTINARATKENVAIIEISFEITDTEQLEKIIHKLSSISGVIEVTRSTN
ncbi:MAG: bifunctional (p)ppGpp synthetase/guanosine-3',5'-bis(diphosphate) 3'-pyrophosphohydrolase [Ruminococcaceae bacterium]|nr:bifunctional (p)ppGpp synthetase/guanosine-3',5'-bis(diphosphate) 3'-pyrophosphohydrolase [Oscillospiraceae bacterium]